jgi:hypothetical protein
MTTGVYWYWINDNISKEGVVKDLQAMKKAGINSVFIGHIGIDLGKVGVMAKVKVNGKYVGGVWTYPYRVDITDAVKTGDNTVKIEVVNTWANRFVGDMFLPEEERVVKPLHNNWNTSSTLPESGLLETVRISL